MALSFVVGFWGVCGPLLLNKQWRIMYFQFLGHMGYKLKGLLLQVLQVGSCLCMFKIAEDGLESDLTTLLILPSAIFTNFVLVMFLWQAIPAMLLALVFNFDHRKIRDSVNLLDINSSKGHKYIWYAPYWLLVF
ncbi:signal peptide peptidase-like 1 [Quercus suber]|uniref:Signal peptide peptidase-like 1 n=1 Tax=Quercus suber TaxID=58331 RepID=A0AAW0JYX2_QUESU